MLVLELVDKNLFVKQNKKYSEDISYFLTF